MATLPKGRSPMPNHCSTGVPITDNHHSPGVRRPPRQNLRGSSYRNRNHQNGATLRATIAGWLVSNGRFGSKRPFSLSLHLVSRRGNFGRRLASAAGLWERRGGGGGGGGDSPRSRRRLSRSGGVTGVTCRRNVPPPPSETGSDSQNCVECRLINGRRR